MAQKSRIFILQHIFYRSNNRSFSINAPLLSVKKHNIFISLQQSPILPKNTLKNQESPFLQVIQKPSFLHQLTNNMTKDSFNSPIKKSSQHVVYKNCFFFFWYSKQYLYTTCSELVFFGEFNEQSLVILWVNWCKNESFWHRFTCI